MLHTIDWMVIGISLSLIIIVGLSYAKRAGKSLESFFLGGRKLPWYIAGISMVATTFAADTPLAVAELVAKNGISGNWLWWNMLAGGILTALFFSHLWRRANILTEVEFIELRYSGNEAAFLRGFKSVYLGLFMNIIIIGFVNLAFMAILQGMFGLNVMESFWYCGLAMLFVGIYSSLSGFLGVAITDAIQFTLAMIGCILLAYFVVTSPQIGGLQGLTEKLPDWRFNFFPSVGTASQVGEAFGISVATFFAFVGFSWWASWYPGAEPGGGGYASQRMMSTRSEKDSVYATLFFQIAHYCLRPWPWILVGLCAVILYPGLEDPKLGFVYVMRDFLPVGFKGLLIAAFVAAYMSTISTQLNWGSSYLTNDLFKRFIAPQSNEKQWVMAGRVITLILMILGLCITLLMDSISGAWQFILECSAGIGMVLILRWYWWRINAWSEIGATIIPVIVLLGLKGASFWFGIEALVFPYSFFLAIGITTISWLAITYVTPPTNDETLRNFYQRIKPKGVWGPYAEISNHQNDNSPLWYGLASWFCGISLVYSLLFATGYFLFSQWMYFGICCAVIVISLIGLKLFLPRTEILGNR